MIQAILFHIISVCPHQTMVHTSHSSFPGSRYLIPMHVQYAIALLGY